MRRFFEELKDFSKKGDWILDPFMGSGTSLIEAQRMGRNSIGIELQPDVAREASERIQTEHRDDCSVKVFPGDSRTINMDYIMESIVRCQGWLNITISNGINTIIIKKETYIWQTLTQIL